MFCSEKLQETESNWNAKICEQISGSRFPCRQCEQLLSVTIMMKRAFAYYFFQNLYQKSFPKRILRLQLQLWNAIYNHTENLTEYSFEFKCMSPKQGHFEGLS